MNEFVTVSDINHDAFIISSAYGGINDSNGRTTETPARNRVVALIREMLGGETVIIRQNARDANDAVSTIQIFTDAIETIAERLIKILELTKKAVELYYSPFQADEIQEQFRNLATEINQIVNSTEYNYNKPFAANGKSISIPIGDGSMIDILAKDFSFDTKGINIVKNPQNVLSMINSAMTNIDEYKIYLDTQTGSLRDITGDIELQIQSVMGVDMKDFQAELAAPMADYTANLISQDKRTSLNIQANLTPDEILKLLKVS